MYMHQTVKMTIEREPEAIWDFATAQKNWALSSSQQPRETRISGEDGAPRTGSTFTQSELIGETSSRVRGHFLYVQKPKIVVWRGIATYDFAGGLVRINIAEGGVFSLKGSGKKTVLNHTIYLDFPNNMAGKAIFWYLKNVLGLQKALYDHNYNEMLFIKRQMEGTAQKAEVDMVLDYMVMSALAAMS